jgi:hypothetical protein
VESGYLDVRFARTKTKETIDRSRSSKAIPSLEACYGKVKIVFVVTRVSQQFSFGLFMLVISLLIKLSSYYEITEINLRFN